MPRPQLPNDYHSLIRSRKKDATNDGTVECKSCKPVALRDGKETNGHQAKAPAPTRNFLSQVSEETSKALLLKPGHVFSYTGIFLFTAILYARPGEFYPSRVTASIALVIPPKPAADIRDLRLGPTVCVKRGRGLQALSHQETPVRRP